MHFYMFYNPHVGTLHSASNHCQKQSSTTGTFQICSEQLRIQEEVDWKCKIKTNYTYNYKPGMIFGKKLISKSNSICQLFIPIPLNKKPDGAKSIRWKLCNVKQISIQFFHLCLWENSGIEHKPTNKQQNFIHLNMAIVLC